MQDIALAGDESEHEHRGLAYPFHGRRPSAGEVLEVAAGVYWVRMPLPFKLDHINLWVLDDGDGLTVVDTGLRSKETKALWELLLAGPFAGKPVKRIVATHFHPDHLGQAGWFAEKFGAPLFIARQEILLARSLMLDAREEAPAEVIDFYRRSGWGEEALERVRKAGWGRYARAVAPLPFAFVALRNGDSLEIGGRTWVAVEGNGHSPAHMCLHAEADGILISGDQVLPRITSNVSVYPGEPEANPLADWLASIEMLRHLPESLLVLPAHNEPFRGLHTRLDQLRDSHMAKLDALMSFLDGQWRTVRECFPVLFGRDIGDEDMMLATGEALAHLHYLRDGGKAERRLVGDVWQYRAECLT